MGPQNGIIGDDFATDIPVTQVSEDALIEEKKAARYSKSAEYKRLTQHMETRIKHFQSYLPGGEAVLDPALQGHRWAVASEVIRELQYVIDFYEDAQTIVKEAERGVE